MSVTFGAVMRLGDSGQMLADPDQDIRGRTVRDRDGNEIGEVDELLIDQETRRVRLLRVAHGGLFGVGATPLFIPVEAVGSVTDGEVGIDHTRVRVAQAPEYDPELVDRDERMARLYDHYGYAPYRTPGHLPTIRGTFR